MSLLRCQGRDKLNSLLLHYVQATNIKPGCLLDLRGPNILPLGHSVPFPWIQTSLSQKPELFSIRVKGLFEPIYSFAKKKRRRVFAFFKSIFLSNARWFYGKKTRKNGKGNLYSTENHLSRNEMWCATDNHNYMCHVCAKGFSDLNFNQAIIGKISNFLEIAPNFTYSRKA